MANTNSENPHVGRQFQELVKTVLEDAYCTAFEQEASIPIGKPAKDHKYDLANRDRSIVAECKCYTWTDSGNVPSAKLMGLDEAVFYFGFLPQGTKKILCMKKRPTKGRQRRSRNTMSGCMDICWETYLSMRFRTMEQCVK